ncbi:MAG: HIRAN domain-containing protein [Pseudomonadota bacterium]
MQRRTFIGTLLGGLGAGFLSKAGSREALADIEGIIIQESPLAGFQYHRAEAVWPFLREGEPLQLVREAANPHDLNAVAVYFRNEKLGYVPRRENTAVAQMLDRGQKLDARIVRLRDEANPWRRVRFSVALAQGWPA